ncbi:hypothetical protein PHLGIDRAFT_111583 [Phlebiopsis gigantea 11061_1 CR5-6]|uniref:Enoyl reductase (ER) domain-containing protein n=1 Tax=Phlebiopsis gigantea (strain 11061_1 CR5-6) TaxID=745531 RepID=A0A0C3NE40_PHLG1|nr:hypothetical protein PHLGIDRAFT_111583 [Phlebiopsis gigantea 11061_1 CR5-6]
MSTASQQNMTAYRFRPNEDTPAVETLQIPTPSADEVLVKILAAGVCHSDLTLLNPKSQMHSALVPAGSFTMGHEAAGVIASLGSNVASTNPELPIGSYVAVYALNSCYKPSCYNCSHGMENRCGALAYGLGSDGSWAAYTAVRATCVVRVPGTPAQIASGVASTATDAILTPYHAMKTCCGVRPEHTVLCVGIGGLGLNAVAIAKRCLGARRVIACDTREVALRLAQEAGADCGATPDSLPGMLADRQLVVDFALDFVGTQATYELCFSAIRCGGTIHVAGIAAPTLSIPPLKAMTKELTFKTSYWGTKRELVEVLQAIADGQLNPKVEMRPMGEVGQVLEDMRNGKLTSRVALYPPAASSTTVSL